MRRWISASVNLLGRRRRSLVWRLRAVRVVPLLLVAALAAGSAGDGVSALPAEVRRADVDAPAAGPAPDQRWDSAAGRTHLVGAPGNRVVPGSVRGLYPLTRLDVRPKARNTAAVAPPPASRARGFDRASSREVPGGRGAFERVFRNADGTHTTEFSPTPVNYRRPDGGWAPIDTRLIPAEGGGWRNAADAVDLRLAPRADSPELVRLALDGDHVVGYGLVGAAAVPGRAESGAVVYPGVLPSVDLRLEARAGGSKDTLVLRSADAPHDFVFPLRLSGLSARLVGGQVLLSDTAGTTRAVIPPGYLVDSGSAVSGPATSTGVRYTLVTAGGRPALRVTLDSAWLRDPARRFPVLLDPAVGPPVDGGSADASMYVHGSNSASGGTELLVGRVGGTNAAAYLKFGGLAGRLQNHTIYGVALVGVNYDAPSCRARPVTVHPVTEPWSPGAGYSYPGPAVGGALASRSFAHGYVALGQSQSACPAAAEMIDLGAAGRSLVQRWVAGQQANHGLSLRASTSDSGAWKRFAGTATANPPRLYVTHTPYNAAYSIPKPTPEPPVLRNQDGRVKVTVTNKGAEAWTPSTYYLAYRAYNARTGAAVTQQRAASLPGTVARNARMTLDATIKRLEPGTYFLDFTMVRTGGAVFTDHQVPPGRIVLQVFDVPPVVQEVYPPNGYQAQTLTPLLWARAIDTDAPPGAALQFKFEVCDRSSTGAPTGCTNSGYQAKPSWPVPAGRLSWSRNYIWRAYVKDGANEVISPNMALLAAVPQPEITSRIANAPYASADTEFDAQVGNYRTAALDATVATVGPELNLVRTYNSLDPRTDSAFGAGWSSRYDMKLIPDEDGSGNVVVRYPDGQAVRFGRNPDGGYAPPPGRTAQLSVDSTAWRLRDRSGTVYQFFLAGAGLPSNLSKVTDNAGRSVVLTYTNGKVSRAQVSNSQTNTAGRSLRFTWVGNHIQTVQTDAVNGAALVWNYTYSGDLLTRVCPPASMTACTDYAYAPGSHYRSAVIDSKPESYWRLGEEDAAGAASEVAVNLGKDAGTYRNVATGAAGALAGTTNKAATFNGSSSFVELPKGTVKKSRDAAVELWFKVSGSETGGPLIAYQDKAMGTAPGAGVPVLYTGSDGLLRGQFAGGTVAPMVSSRTVWDNAWHHAVISVMGTTQTMYLDGVKVGERTGQGIEHSPLTFNQIGAGSAATPGSWPGWGPTVTRFFQGGIDEVAIYSHPLGPAAVTAHFQAGRAAAQQLSKVTLPSGRIGAEMEYDTAADRITEYTDDNGGTWKIGLPMVYGGDADLRRSVQVLDPGNRPHLYEYDALAGRILRSGTPLGLETRAEDRPAEPTPAPAPSPTPTCTQPDPNDPGFCTVIPGDSGGPVFVGHTLNGLAIRSFEYDEQGNQKKVTNENGDSVELGYDDRGNATSRKTCRLQGECYTAYSKYPPSPTDPLDPRSDLVTEARDGRSASATDTTYRTSYSYHATGQLDVQTNPDGSSVDHDYTSGLELAIGGGQVPAGLLAATTDARGKTTRYAYHQNGDLARVTGPPPAGQSTGMVTEFGYDPVGRKITEKVISDAYPAGLVTTYTYDTNSRIATVTQPATTDAVTGTRHQRRVVNEYDPDGNVTKVTVSDLLGGDAARVTTTEYDEHGRPQLVTDPESGQTGYDYDRFGNTTSMQDANGNRYDYAYTARNAVAEVRLRGWRSDPPGSPATGTGDHLVLHSYSYDYAGRLASDTDAMGRRLQYEYYADDLLRRVVLKNFHDPGGATRDYVIEENTYDGAGHLTRRVEANGRLATTHTVDRAGKVASTVADPGRANRTNTFTFDANGNVTKATRTGNSSNVPGFDAHPVEQVEYGYDDAGNVTSEKVTAGTQTRLTSYTYDRRGLRTSATDPRGNETGADKAAFTSNYEHDELGQLVKVTGPPVVAETTEQASATVRPVDTLGYNSFGEQVTAKDAVGRVTRSQYDRAGRLVRQIAPSHTPPGASTPVNPTSILDYDALGNLIARTAPGGSVSRFVYDQLNRVTVRDEPADTNDQRALTRFTYTRTGEVLSVTGPTGARVESTYDDLDRPVTSTQFERYPQAGTFTTTMSYNDLGDVRSITTPSGAATLNEFDTVGQLIKTTSPTGVVSQFGYDYAGRQVYRADGLGRASLTTFNQFGDRTADADLKPGTAEVLRRQTYGYDPAGNMTSSTDPYQRTTSYTYDAADRLTKQVEPVTADRSITTAFGYDAAGQRTRYTDGRGNAFRYTHNSLGLPEAVIEPATTAHPGVGDRTWSVGYDQDGQPIRLVAPGGVVRSRGYDAAGRLRTETGTGAEAATAQRTLGYDLAGRLTAASTPGGANTYTYGDRGGLLTTSGPGGTTSFSYNSDGNLTGRTDAAGTATFGYDRGRLRTLADGQTGTTQTLGYDAAGELKSIDYGAGRLRTLDYDDFGHLTGDVLKSSGGSVITSIGYGYDLNGHVTSKTTAGTTGAGNNTYGYDFAGRLTSWTGPGGVTAYEWDDSGNRTRAGAKTAGYDQRNRLLSDGDYTYAYTPRGTLRTRTSSGLAEQYSFDAFDRMTSAAGQTYTYDGLDRVTARNGIAFTYAGLADEPVAYGSERYARGPGDELLATGQGTTKRLAIADAHGDIVAELDPLQTTPTRPAASTAYDPFGARIASDARTSSTGYQGDWTDPSTGQVDMGARWYNPGTGGFVSRDSAGYNGGDSILANRYTYGAGAPLDFDDPDGQWPRWLSSAVNTAKSSAGRAWNSFTSTVGRGWNTFTGWVSTGWSYGWSAVKSLGKKLWRATKWVYHKSGLSTVVNAASEGARTFRKDVTNWAKRQAADAGKRLHQARVAVTRAAKTAIAQAVRFTPLPALAAVTKPLLKNLGKAVVSTTAKLAARFVAVTVTAIRDPNKFATSLYKAASEKAGAVIENVSKAASAVGEWVVEHKDAIIEGLAIVGAIAAGVACTAATAGAAAVACVVGAAALINLAKDTAQGDVRSLGGALRSAGTGAAQGLLGSGAGAIGARVAGAVTSNVAGFGGRVLAGGVGGGGSDAVYQAATTGRVDAGGVAMSAGIGAVTGGLLRSPGCGGNSFTPTAAVVMADGSRKVIEQVEVGEKVLATDPTTGRTEAREVTDVIVGDGEKRLVEITVATGGGKTSTVTATDEHPFWVDGLNRWVNAKDLKPGYRFQTADHRSATVVGTHTRTRHHRVYNLTVDGIHTYYIAAGDRKILVHNCGPGARDGAGLSPDQLMAASRKLRDDYANELAGLPKSSRPPITVSAGYNTGTGQYAAGANREGVCAEWCVVDQLGGDPSNIVFTSAVRPRTGRQVRICPACEVRYGRDAFQEPGTNFKSDLLRIFDD
jgi:RHS repeat-associated protein